MALAQTVMFTLIAWRQTLLAKNRLSNDVDAVKPILGVAVGTLESRHHFALVEGVACAHLKPARNNRVLRHISG